MGAMQRRKEILNILFTRRHTTAAALAHAVGVYVRTIQNNIKSLSFNYPVYTKQGGNSGIFIGDSYKNFSNTLTSMELEVLIELYEKLEGRQKEIFSQIIRKYGPDKLKF